MKLQKLIRTFLFLFAITSINNLISMEYSTKSTVLSSHNPHFLFLNTPIEQPIHKCLIHKDEAPFTFTDLKEHYSNYLKKLLCL